MSRVRATVYEQPCIGNGRKINGSRHKTVTMRSYVELKYFTKNLGVRSSDLFGRANK